MTTTRGAHKRRGFAAEVDAMLDAGQPAPSSSTSADDVEPAPLGDAPGADAATSGTAANVDQVDQVDDDGPRLRASALSTLAGGDVRRTVYVGADDWRRVLRLAMRQGLTASDVVRSALRSYLAQHGGDGPTS